MDDIVFIQCLKPNGKKNKQLKQEIDLRIVEYTSQRIPPVQYINISISSLLTEAKGSDAMTWPRLMQIMFNVLSQTGIIDPVSDCRLGIQLPTYYTQLY